MSVELSVRSFADRSCLWDVANGNYGVGILFVIVDISLRLHFNKVATLNAHTRIITNTKH